MMHVTLRTSALSAILGQLQARFGKGAQVEAGFIDGGITADKDPRISPNKTIQQIATYAAYNEYGTQNIPARPFMHKAAQVRGASWKQTLTKALAKGVTAQEALNYAGAVMRDDLRESLTGGLGGWQANAPSTIKSKTRITQENQQTVGRNTPKPLIDTGDMLRAIGYKVSDGGVEK